MAVIAQGMPCNAHGEQQAPDCHKKCPLMASCMANWLQYAPAASATSLVLRAVSAAILPHDDAEQHGLTKAPSPRPPQA